MNSSRLAGWLAGMLAEVRIEPHYFFSSKSICRYNTKTTTTTKKYFSIGKMIIPGENIENFVAIVSKDLSFYNL